MTTKVERNMIVHTYWELQSCKLCYSQELGCLTEKGKYNDARHDYFDHFWNSGSQDSNRQEPYREFCLQIIYSFTVDYCPKPQQLLWSFPNYDHSVMHVWVLGNIAFTGILFFAGGETMVQSFRKKLLKGDSDPKTFVTTRQNWTPVCQLKGRTPGWER